MKKMFPAALALVVVSGAALPARAATIIISEYIEGTSNNKAIELFNRTASPINLATGGYSLEHYFNGAVMATNIISLIGIIPANGTYVIANTLAAPAVLAAAQQTSASLNFNGDDAVALKQGAAFVDVLGQIGFDPGVEWGTLLQSTMDNTLRRKSGVCSGDPDGANLFDPSIEWDGFATDTFTGLGSHTTECAPVGVEAQTWGVVKHLFR